MTSNGPKSTTSTPAAKPVVTAAIKPQAKPAVAAKPVVATPVAAVPAKAAPKTVVVAPTATRVVTPEAPEPATAPAAAIIQKDVTLMENTIKAAAEKVQAQAKSLFGDVNDRTKTAMEKGSKMFEDMNDFSKGNVEALVESSKIAAKGAEDIAKYTTEYVKASVEKANAAAKEFAAVKSPTELFKLQSEHAKSAMDTMMAETAKFTESYLKLLGEIAQPISNRVAIAAEKMKIAA